MSRKARFEFVPRRKKTAAARPHRFVTECVLRNVVIHAEKQLVGGQLEEVTVTILEPPSQPPPKPPEAKGIQRLICFVADPLVRVKRTGQILHTFAPPLTITVDITAEDAKAALRDPATGKPSLSLVTCYIDEKGGWHYERLDPIVSFDKAGGGGKLTAKIKTLHPNDPMWEGSP